MPGMLLDSSDYKCSCHEHWKFVVQACIYRLFGLGTLLPAKGTKNGGLSWDPVRISWVSYIFWGARLTWKGRGVGRSPITESLVAWFFSSGRKNASALFSYVKRLGYTMAHIWACPPSEGDDYIFHCHPPEQKIPKPKRLQVSHSQISWRIFSIWFLLFSGLVQKDVRKGCGWKDSGWIQRYL